MSYWAERPRKGGPRTLAGRQAARCRHPDFEIKSLARDQRSTLSARRQGSIGRHCHDDLFENGVGGEGGANQARQIQR